MPTFNSIPIHPSVRSRLDRPQERISDDCSVQNGPMISEFGHKMPAKSSVQIPRSLLTRDPNELKEIFSFGTDGKNEQQLAGVMTLRSEVALKMISTTKNGKRLLSLRTINRQLDDSQKRIKGIERREDNSPIIPGGSITLLDSWENRLFQKDNCAEVVSTGYPALDDLIAFPSDYLGMFDDNENDATRNNIDRCSGESKGLPRGYVLQLSGESGKTQLALQIVAQVMIQFYQEAPTSEARIRYCYSSAGHAGHSLARRLFQLLKPSTSKGGTSDHKLRKEMMRNIEFQSITDVTQLVVTLAKLEQEWMENLETQQDRQKQQEYSTKNKKSPVTMIVLDGLTSMLVERETADKIQSVNRCLKRLARHYLIWIVVITPTHSSGSFSSQTSLYSEAFSPDIHLNLNKKTSDRSSLSLMCHPAKVVTKKDCVPFPHDSKFIL